MGRRRGFFAELQHQNQLAAKRQAQAERAYFRAQIAAQRDAERALKQADRAAAHAARASAADQRAAEKEAKRLHEEARNAEVAALNARLAEVNDELDSILCATLGVDDFVDLEELRVQVEHPPFPRADLETLTAEPTPITAPSEPVFLEPEPAKGLGAMFGGKKKHAEAAAPARAAFDTAHQAWQAAAAAVPAQQLDQMQKRDAAEKQRLAQLEEAREVYQRESDEREAETAETNRALDELIVELRTGSDAAVQEYVGIVLGNSVYPDVLAVEHDFEFDSELKELTLTVLVSPPDSLPAEKEFKWVKSKDEITATALPKKDLKAQYARVVFQVALRTLHEVFEADRAEQIQTISLAVATETNDPATGRQTRVTFIAVAAERSAFMSFDLSNIVPLATLQHLGAEISKSPYDLVGIDQSQGVRTR